MIRPWLKQLRRHFFPVSRRGGLAIRPARPLLEQLESRVVPAGTYTVTTTADSGTGGAIGNEFGSMTITNSTFNGNKATNNGGGAISNDNPLFDYGFNDSLTGNSLTVKESTLSGNSGKNNAGGILNDSSDKIRLLNTIVAGNTATSDPDIYENSGTGSATYSLIGNN